LAVVAGAELALDLIHNQADFVPLAFSRLVETPVVTTIHGFSSERILPAFKAYEDRVHYVAISDADRHRDLRYAATIHHGVRLEDFPFDPRGSDDLLFFGRIHPDKGAAEAIAVARQAGRRLVMAGIVQDQDYYSEHVAPTLDDRCVVYHGPVGGADPHANSGFRLRASPPHQLRRALRTIGRGGARQRHACHSL
jgi:glycosyltransferase involved in cell wall biosynthesis